MYRAVKQVILMVEMVVRDRDVIIISQSTSMEPVEVSVAATGLTCPDDYFMMSLATALETNCDNGLCYNVTDW